ncbi:MAG: choline/ethanolamine kinase family protein [Roseibium album]|uniref:choline/ethanolamine kinase family protein n=1 Tax=Roseibium album TaxID=311410 RepID=UPI0032EC9CAE
MTASTNKLRQQVTALRPDWEPDQLSGFLYLEGGYSNHNYRFSYRGERFVLRVPFTRRPELNRHLEHRVYDGIAGGHTPELVAFDPDSGAMISRWVPGTLLADSDPDADSLVDYLTHLHRQLPALTHDYDPVAQARAQLAGADAPAWMERLAADLHWAPENTATCHNDLNPWNVIRTPDRRWVTLDWEWVGRNDPLFDLVTLHQGAEFDPDVLQPMARSYLGAPVAAERLQRCLTAFWLRETSWALAEIRAGSRRAEVTEQRDRGLARLRELA